VQISIADFSNSCHARSKPPVLPNEAKVSLISHGSNELDHYP